ncbi:MAG: hypothetical protein CUN52_11750 [Phototrophicales bacterium]|nr:MAG: hypothetical protein CUN52_11750 [Phototrophicales bacterium]
MSDIDLDSALSQFYEDESLTDALTDQPADALLKWGESQVQFLAQQAHDTDEFDAQFTALRKLIRNVSKFVAEHQDMPLDEQAETLSKITSFAQNIGLSINRAITDIIDEQKNLTDTDSVTHVLAQFAKGINPVVDEAVSATPPPSETPSTDAPVDDITEILPKGGLMDFVNKITSTVADIKKQIEQASSADDTTTPDDDHDI